MTDMLHRRESHVLGRVCVHWVAHLQNAVEKLTWLGQNTELGDAGKADGTLDCDADTDKIGKSG